MGLVVLSDVPEVFPIFEAMCHPLWHGDLGGMVVAMLVHCS